MPRDRSEPAVRPSSARPSRAPGITVYGCEPDEARLFRALAPRFGIVPVLTSVPVTVLGRDVVPVPGGRCVSVGHKSEVSAAVLHALKDAGVEHLSTRSIGLDHIDLGAAQALGIVVENAPYAPDGVADFTLMLVLMAVRRAKRIALSASRHDFRVDERARELRDLTVGVVGVGRIGSAVIDRLRGFGCRVLAHDPGASAPPPAECVSLGELLRMSDVVTLHLPLRAETRHLIGHDELQAMKRGAILVNTARGALVDTGALVGALESGRLGGAAVDVLEGEEGSFYLDRTTTPVDDPFLRRLLELPHAIVTPHTAYYTEGALRDTVEQTLARCLSFERSRR